MPFTQVNYKRLYYKDWAPENGAEAKATIVMGHGLGSSNNYYTAIVPSLVSQGYRCICLDTTGSGLSSYSYIEQTVHTLAADVIDLMDNLSIPKAIYVGHSMSGMTGPELAAEWPGRITGIVLIGPVFPTKDVAPMFEQRIATVAEKGMDTMADTVPFSAVGSEAQPIHRAFIRELILGTAPEAYISLCKVISDAWKAPPKYEKVECPVLIIAGDEDKSAPLAGCEKIMNALGTKSKKMEVLKGVGHWQCVEAPEDVGALIVEFMRQF